MSEYLSNRQRKLNIGITSYTENQLVLDVTGNSNFSGDISIGKSVYDSLNFSGNNDDVLSSTPNGVQWKESGIGIGTETIIGVGITVLNFLGFDRPDIVVENKNAYISFGNTFPIGDYGDLTSIRDAFGICIAECFDCLTEPKETLDTIDLGVL
jgi:hypothetical protein